MNASSGFTEPAGASAVVYCAAVVLAAGKARRFGAPKLLMPFGESTVLGSVIRALASAGIAPIVVVAGVDAEGVQSALSELPAEIVRNPNPDGGMVSSIRIGVEALPPTVERFLIVLGDQPRVRAEDISRLVGEHAMSGKAIAMPVFGGKRGHPIVFAGEYRRLILGIADGQTLRDLIEAHSDDIVEVECPSDAYVNDIDTREEYEQELRRWQSER